MFSYVDPNTSTNPDKDKSYVVLTEIAESKTAGTTTYTYTEVDVEVGVVAVGVGDTVAFDTKVKAAIPEATDYGHIHFGVWAALGEAEADGSQDIADLGIGFLQNYSGEGLTGADMPNNGDATYSGNWAGTVRQADEDGNGDISLESGAASLKADFEEASIEATLTGLATLSGDIAGNTFMARQSG